MPLRNGARFEFKVQDCWIGWYWERNGPQFDLWICLIPMVPLHIRRLHAPKGRWLTEEMDDDEYESFMAALGDHPLL